MREIHQKGGGGQAVTTTCRRASLVPDTGPLLCGRRAAGNQSVVQNSPSRAFNARSAVCGKSFRTVCLRFAQALRLARWQMPPIAFTAIMIGSERSGQSEVSRG
jgi:hypothetical protein